MEVRDRNLLETLLKSEFERAKRYDLQLSCIVVCVSGLTENIEKRGAAFLDKILDESIALLSSMVRASDIIAPYTKEKLLVVLPMVNIDGTSFVAQRIQRVFSQYELPDQPTNKLAVSMGISNVSDKGVNTPGDLIRCAETALAQALSQGGDTPCLWRDLA